LPTSQFFKTDFKINDLGVGTSAYQYFGLASPPLPKRALPIPDDFRPQVREVIKLRGVGMADSNGMTHERNTLRDLGQFPPERAITIDENENVVLCGRDGIWVKTGKKLSSRPKDVLQDSLRIPDLVQQNKLRNMQEQLDLDPHSLVNTSVYRRFTPDGMGYKTGSDDGSSDDPVAHRVVKEFWLENGLHRWRILYDNFHVEDFDKDEMMEFGLDRKSGSVATFPHIELPATELHNQINSNPWVTIKPKRKVTKSLPADRAALLLTFVIQYELPGHFILQIAFQTFRICNWKLLMRFTGCLNESLTYIKCKSCVVVTYAYVL
jgi:hypothetical protein